VPKVEIEIGIRNRKGIRKREKRRKRKQPSRPSYPVVA
jgi:hypothetical protein